MAVDKTPEQIIFDAVYMISDGLGFPTYDYLPPDKAGYPFVWIGNVLTEDRHTKPGIFWDAFVTVHVFHHYRRRIEVTSMLGDIKREAYRLREENGLYIRCRSGDIELTMDDTTPDLLLHGMMDLEFTLNY